MHGTSACFGLLKRHRPGFAAGLGAHGPQLAVECGQRMRHAVPLQHGGHAVHPVSFGNATQVELRSRVLAGAACGPVQLQRLLCRVGCGWHGLACGADGRCIGRIAHRAKPPGIDQCAHARIERAAAQALHVQRTVQHLQHFGGQIHPGADGGAVQAHQVAAGFPGRHLVVHLFHRRGQVFAQGCQVQGGVGIEGDRPARAHARAVQGGALAGRSGLRTRLRHNAPWL